MPIEKEISQTFPTYFNVGTKAAWNSLNNKANKLLGFPDGKGTDNYSNPIIDKNGDYWFAVNPEVQKLVDLKTCQVYDEIKFDKLKLK